MLRVPVILLLLLSIINFDGVTSRSIYDTILSDNVEIMPSLKFSSLPSRSDVQRNMVITGIRFARRSSRICIEIKQGKLLPGGEIDNDSQEWTAYDVSRVILSAPAHRLEESRRPDGDYIEISEESDYVDLDDVVDQNDRVVTGVAFGLTNGCPGVQHIKLRLEFTGFNFTSGQLDSNRTFLSSSTRHRNEINMTDKNSPNDPTEPTGKNIHNFGRFNLSELRGNGDQTMQFLLNYQFLESDPLAPLTGIELFYETYQRVDGVLALRIHFLNDSTSEIVDKSSYDDPYTNNSKKAVRRVKRDYRYWYYRSYEPWNVFYISLYVFLKSLLLYFYCKRCGSSTTDCCSTEIEVPVNAIPMPAPDHMR